MSTTKIIIPYFLIVAVVWNPWESDSKSMGDMDDDGWRSLLCVEAGKVASPQTLEAGDKYDCSQTFRIQSNL